MLKMNLIAIVMGIAVFSAAMFAGGTLSGVIANHCVKNATHDPQWGCICNSGYKWNGRACVPA